MYMYIKDGKTFNCMRNWNLYKRLESIPVLNQFLSITGACWEPKSWLTVVWHGVAVAQLDLVVPDLHILVSLHTAGCLLSALELQDGTPTQVQRAKVKEQAQTFVFYVLVIFHFFFILALEILTLFTKTELHTIIMINN